MHSMTSFGKGKLKLSGGDMEITIKSVNHRYLDIRIHTPRWLAHLEGKIKKKIAEEFQRGAIEIYWQFTPDQAKSNPEIFWNKKLADKWIGEFRELCQDMKIRSDINHELILRVPELYSIRDENKLSKTDETNILKLIVGVSKKCVEERKREGAAICKDLKIHISTLKKITTSWKGKRDSINKHLKNKYQEKLKKLGSPAEVDPQRLAQEIVMQVDKADISEELQRLAEHLKAVESWLKKKESMGKRLDFFAQEILREINTVGSKSSSVEITHGVVEAKSEVEKFREQVQNVE